MSENVVVTVNEGKVRGIKKTTNFCKAPYYAFYGVPYAQPPTGELRFKDPVKVKPWKDVHDARIEKEGCIQFSMYTYVFSGSEDCLYVNIYSPKLPSKNQPLLPVVANIHAGGHLWGSPDTSQYGSPDYLMHRDIVYVTIGYRLHILGFLNLNLDNCSGNQGLKDIMLALQWIKNNIQFFNGDSNNVTLLGSSSGASTIHILMLSPAAKGLFHKAVLMGHYLFNCSVLFQEEHIKLAFEFGYSLGFRGDDRKKLLRFLKNQPPTSFVTQMRYFQKKFDTSSATVFPCGVFLPTIDSGGNAVLPVSPRQLISSMQRIPLVFGMCDKEAAVGFTRGFKDTTERNFWKAWYQNPWGWLHDVDEDARKFIEQQIRSFYLKDCPQNEISTSTKIDILTDASFSDVYDTLINVIADDLPSSVFLYKFRFEGEANTLKERLSQFMKEPIEGTIHSDDLSYWSCLAPSKPTREKTVQIIEMFTKLTSTFAQKGDPNYEGFPVQWRPTTKQQPCHLVINDTVQMVDEKLNGERFVFWERLKKHLTNK